MRSDFREPLNIGSDEMVSMNDMADMALKYAGKSGAVKINHIPGPEGVRGRNSDNTLIKKVLGWAPNINLADGLQRTFKWIDIQVTKSVSPSPSSPLSLTLFREAADGFDVTTYAQSHVVRNRRPDQEFEGAKK